MVQWGTVVKYHDVRYDSFWFVCHGLLFNAVYLEWTESDMGVTLLTGEETYLREQALREIRERCIPEGMQSLCHHVMRNPSPSECLDKIGQTMMVFAGTPLIEIHQFGPLSKAVKESDKKVLNDLKSTLENLPDNREVVFVTDKVDGKRALPKWFKKEKWITTTDFAVLPFYKADDAIAQLIQYSKKEGRLIEPAAAKLLVDSYGVALMPLMNEVKKLAVYAGECSITRDHVLTLSNHHENAFQMLEQWVTETRRVEVFQILHEILQKDSPMRLFGLINVQLDYLFQMCDLHHRGWSTDLVADKLKKHPYKVKMDWQQYRRVPIERLRLLWQESLNKEWQVKQGVLSDRLSLETLMAL